MSDLFLSRIRLYPIKGCAGTDVELAHMDERGLRYDHRWLLVNELGLGLQQLDVPRLACVVATLTAEGLTVRAPGMPTLYVPLQPQCSTPIVVRWYQGRCEALPVSAEADGWFQRFLAMPCRLVFMQEETERFVAPAYAINHERAAFTSFPYHLIGEGSLTDLNQRLEEPVGMERFRPNLVVTGTPAFAEDDWHTLKINDYLFHVVKPCNRCTIITVDPETGIRTNTEPLTTLARYRTFEQKVLFGQYLLSSAKGTLHVGDAVEIIA